MHIVGRLLTIPLHTIHDEQVLYRWEERPQKEELQFVWTKRLKVKCENKSSRFNGNAITMQKNTYYVWNYWNLNDMNWKNKYVK